MTPACFNAFAKHRYASSCSSQVCIVAIDSAPVTAGSTALARTDVVSGNISAAGATDVYTFSATSGESLDITLTETGGFTSSVPQGQLIAPSGVVVGLPFNGTTTVSFASLPETGVYVIRIAANTLFHIGTYDLEVQ